MVSSAEAPRTGTVIHSARVVARRQRVRERLLAAGGRLVAARGLAKLSVEDILAETGVSRRSFYSYFENKYELAAGVINRALLDGEEMIRALGGRRPAAILPGIVSCYQRLWASHRDALIAIASLETDIRPYIEEAHEKFGSALKKELKRAEKAGLLRNADALCTFRVISRTAVPLLKIYADHPDGVRLYEQSMLALLQRSGANNDRRNR